MPLHRFSPLREGDTSVGRCHRTGPASYHTFQSPSRGGHLRGLVAPTWTPAPGKVSVPFARGTPPWARGKGRSANKSLSFSPLREGDTSVGPVPVPRRPLYYRQFQSPSRGGHLRGPARRLKRHHRHSEFQSPSRGGHLRGPRAGKGQGHHREPFQSPSRGGHLRGPLTIQGQTVTLTGFSPLREGDTSVGTAALLENVDG